VVAPKEKARLSKSHISKENKRQRRMEISGVIDERILFADFSRIRKMAGDYRELVKQQPERYVQLRHCATFDDVKNGGPPFQIDGDLYATWYQETSTRCPVMLRYLMAFFQQRVAYNKDRTSPVPRSDIQPHLRNCAAAFLTASPAIAQMTISMALQKLLKYAKVLGSERVTEEIVAFVDPLIYKYVINELDEVTAQLEDVRKHLQLSDECCDLVLKRNDFAHEVMNWKKSDVSYHQIYCRPTPTSLNDADAAKSQLKETNVLVKDLVNIFTASLRNIRDWTEAARAWALPAERKIYQDAVDSESSILQDKRNAILQHYAVWCPYVQQFCEALHSFHEEIDERSIDEFIECCKQTAKTIQGLLQGVKMTEAHEDHLRGSMEFLEGMVAVLRGRQERARKTKENRERDEEKEAAFREQIVCKSDEDFWDEYDRLRAQSLDPIEQKVLLEERTRRKAKQVQKSQQESWRDKPAMDDGAENARRKLQTKRHKRLASTKTPIQEYASTNHARIGR
jgi:hypothetical protein